MDSSEAHNTSSTVRRIVVGVGAGIAAYKMCTVVRAFAEMPNTTVRVIPTEAALEFVGAATFEALSHQPVTTEVFDNVPSVAHIGFGKSADLVVIAPATADLLAQLASGSAHDLLTATVLTARCPVIIFPAMHTEMYDHPATKRNIATLREFGYTVINPASGRLTGKDTGIGRLPEPQEIIHLSSLLLERSDALPYDLAGKKVLVSAGGTREALDPVRYLTNRSSGKQGYALACIGHARGAEVTLVSANTATNAPTAGVRVVPVDSARRMHQAMLEYLDQSDIVIMSAAVADYRPCSESPTKVKKDNGTLTVIPLTENPDILVDVVHHRSPDTCVVGFAAETGDETHSVLDYAHVKLEKKGCDLLVVNAVGNGCAFEVDDNTGWILTKNHAEQKLPLGSKFLMASYILDSTQRFMERL